LVASSLEESKFGNLKRCADQSASGQISEFLFTQQESVLKKAGSGIIFLQSISREE
jgi:hypothetical protein